MAIKDSLWVLKAGVNVKGSVFEVTMDCNKSKIFEVSLDDKINYVPKNPFYIDCFYIKSIVYEDGSTWENYFSSYTISGDQL